MNKSDFYYEENLERQLNILQQENQQLKKELDYLKSGEYHNQLRLERNMLQDVVDNGKVSKDDREFIDMTHRNTKLLVQLKQRDEVIEKLIVNWSELEKYIDTNKMILNNPNIFQFYLIQKEILQKYKGENND